ncbi:MAG: TonB-dependent receptor [Synoicihabitans sp.]
MPLKRPSLFASALRIGCVVMIVNPIAGQTTTSEETMRMDPLTIFGRSDDLMGRAMTASQGRVAAAEIDSRPLLRRGEMLEVMPGLIVTQHSGGGKANQYFLRGYNLDHGTDLSLAAEGVPINLRTHGHGQGYADINFVIPELVRGIAFRKGPFFADVGDFSAAGAARLEFWETLPHAFVSLAWGENNHRRLVAGATAGDAAHGAMTAAVEWVQDDGPFLLPEDFARTNVFLRHHRESENHQLTITAMAYSAEWTSTDQIPVRAIADGTLDRFGFVDPTDGGDSDRFSLTVASTWQQDDSETRLDAYAFSYQLDLFSNFTYFLDDPLNGDQFEQVDDRIVLGGTLTHTWTGQDQWQTSHTVGLQTQLDLIDEVGLHRTRERTRLSTVRTDEIQETSVATFWQSETAWTDHFRTIAGLRADAYWFDVTSDLPANSGTARDYLISPKFSAVYSPHAKHELYAGAGLGFHSNDARGTTIAVDPTDGSPADPVDPLARSRGIELGWRSNALPGWITSIALFHIENDSELVFVGDAGGTEAAGASRRHGLEWTNFYQPKPWLSFEADLALTRARFENAPGADHIPGAIDRTFSGSVRVGAREGWFGEARARHFGPRVLTEDGAVKGKASTLTNLRLGWRQTNWEVALDVLNLFDEADNDIEYYYGSRLAGEPAGGLEGIHLHPVEPRTVRLMVSWRH